MFLLRRPQGVIDDPSNYHIYTGRKSDVNGKSAYRYDNRAYESQDQGYHDNGQNKEQPYWWVPLTFSIKYFELSIE